MQTKTLRVGVTMRVVHAQGYEEPRDALAQDWWRFLDGALPQAMWIPLPNLGPERIGSYCDQWDLNRLIFTGGDDIGVSDIRDKTELALLDWAMSKDIPVLGICRGMQLLSVWAGTGLKEVENHVCTRHGLNGELSGEVNSFHKMALSDCPASFEIIARSEDGCIEAIRHVTRPLEGWMWHPEREWPIQIADIQRLQRIFL